MLSIMDWKVAGELVSPKNITVGSKSPLLHMKAALYSSPSLILMLLKAHWISSLVKYLAVLTLLSTSEMSGNGQLFLIVSVLMRL